MENLNKDNFWNKQYQETPEAVQVFCDWIDQYKADVYWNELFNADYYKDASSESTEKTEAPKFHALPLAMQIGILQQFAADVCAKYGVQQFKRVNFNLYPGAFVYQLTTAADFFKVLQTVLKPE